MAKPCGCNGTPPPEAYASPPQAYVLEGDDSGQSYTSLTDAMFAAAPGQRIRPVTPADV